MCQREGGEREGDQCPLRPSKRRARKRISEWASQGAREIACQRVREKDNISVRVHTHLHSRRVTECESKQAPKGISERARKRRGGEENDPCPYQPARIQGGGEGEGDGGRDNAAAAVKTVTRGEGRERREEAWERGRVLWRDGAFFPPAFFTFPDKNSFSPQTPLPFSPYNKILF